MGINCEINLYKPADEAYVPGSNIEGVIKYAFDKETTVTKIILSLKGSGYLQIRDKRRETQEHTYVYTNHENYVDDDHIIQNDEKTFDKGLYELKFSLCIPNNLPPTLEYSRLLPFYNIRCVIGYYIRIKFERSGIFNFDKHFRKEITLVSGITPRFLTAPAVHGEEKQQPRLFSWKANDLNIKVNIESCVVTPGIKIELVYEVVNDSQVAVNAIELVLAESYTFKPKGYVTINVQHNVSDTASKTQSIGAGQTQKFCVVMNVPTQMTSINNSNMLSRDYYVKMAVLLPMPHSNTTINIPVPIGDHSKAGGPVDVKNDESAYNPNAPGDNQNKPSALAYNPNAPEDNQYNPSTPAYNPNAPEDNQNNPSALAYNPSAPANNQYAPSAPPYIPGVSANNLFSSSALLSDNSNDPPPSYWEAMREHKEGDDKHANSD